MVNTAKGYATAPAATWNYDMDELGAGVSVLLLNQGGVCVKGSVTAETRKDFMAWSPYPKRDKELERQLLKRNT